MFEYLDANNISKCFYIRFDLVDRPNFDYCISGIKFEKRPRSNFLFKTGIF